MLRPAVFLDRDGTLNREVNFLRRPEELELLPGVGEGLRSLSAAGYALVVATNQSAVARGYLTEEALAEIHARLEALLLAEDVELSGIEYCPHHPEVGSERYRVTCACRKPRPGMLLQAAERLGLDLASSWMIGDSERDLAAGEAAGARSVLVGTGNGEAELARMTAQDRGPKHVAAGMREAAALVLG